MSDFIPPPLIDRDFFYEVDNLWIWMCSEGWLIYDDNTGHTYHASTWRMKENENEQV